MSKVKRGHGYHLSGSHRKLHQAEASLYCDITNVVPSIPSLGQINLLSVTDHLPQSHFN